MANTELYHWGIKGQKWGVRRFQTKDGSLTADGKKRYTSRKTKKALAKARATREKNKQEAAERKAKINSDKLSPKKMTDAELRERIARLELEKDYMNAVKNSKISTSRGSRFVEKFLDSTADKVAENSTADVVAQLVKSAIASSVNSKLNLTDEYKVHTNNKKK